MLSTDPRTMNMVALGVAKLSFGSLSTMRRYLGNDLELGLIGFAVVLRTRRDWFEYVHHHGLTSEVIEMINSHKGYTTSIYEIANFTGISRATVRRKMAKLEKLGIVERTKNGSWSLIDFQHGEPSRPALMLQEMLRCYITVTQTLEHLLPDEVDQAKALSAQEGAPVAPYALLEDEADDKRKRGQALD